MLLVSCCDGPVVFDFIEESLDSVAQFVEAGVEGQFADPLRHEPYVGQDTARCHFSVQGIGVIGTISKQNISCAQTVEHIGGAASIMSLAWRDLEQDRQAIGIDQRVDLGGQPSF